MRQRIYNYYVTSHRFNGGGRGLQVRMFSGILHPDRRNQGSRPRQLHARRFAVSEPRYQGAAFEVRILQRTQGHLHRLWRHDSG